MTGWVGERILADLRKQLFGHLQRLSLGFYERNRAGVLISRMTNDVEAIDQLVTDGVTTLAQSTLTAQRDGGPPARPRLAARARDARVIPFMSVATLLFRSRSARAYAAVRERLGLVTATLAEDISGMRMVQAFVREQRATENFRAVARALPRVEHADGRPERRLLPVRQLPRDARARRRARLRRPPLPPATRSRSRRCSPSCST